MCVCSRKGKSLLWCGCEIKLNANYMHCELGRKLLPHGNI